MQNYVLICEKKRHFILAKWLCFYMLLSDVFATRKDIA